MVVWFIEPPRHDPHSRVLFLVSESWACHDTADDRGIYYGPLVEWFHARGVVVYVAVSRGARIANGDYEELILGLCDLAEVDPDYIVVVTMGDDVLDRTSYSGQFRDDLEHLHRVADEIDLPREVVPHAMMGIFFVGSSTLFESQHDADHYDRCIATVSASLRLRYAFVDNMIGLGYPENSEPFGDFRSWEEASVMAYMARVIWDGFDLHLLPRARL